MEDRGLLEMAAKAAGYRIELVPDQDDNIRVHAWMLREDSWDGDICIEWNPLNDDGDAFRLAHKLGIQIKWFGGIEIVRRAIVFEAAAIGGYR